MAASSLGSEAEGGAGPAPEAAASKAAVINRLSPLLARRTVRVAAYYLYVALVVLYAGWRVTGTLFRQPGALQAAFEVVYALMEAILIAASLRMMSLLRERIERSDDATRDVGWWRASGASPLVDLLIPTYNEPERVLEKSVAGAKQLAYDNYRIWVLDDGARENVRALARRMGVNYLARRERAGAKAGNLNHAVAHLMTLDRPPQFVAVVDSDYVVQPEFMRRTLALMKDPRVGLAQTPQLFWNSDPFQAAFPRGNPLPDDLRFSYDTMHPAQDQRGFAWCRGTSFIIRVDTLRDIGGFPTRSLVEDVMTTQRMQAAGWRTVYLDEALSFGLAAESLAEFLMQRHRWARGFAQIGRMAWDEGRGSPLRQRLARTEARLRWAYTALIQTVLIFGVPAAYWWLGLRPYRADGRQMLLWGLPMLLFFRVYMTWISQGRNLPVFREANQLTQVPALAGGAWRGLLRPSDHAFVVTAKGLQRDGITVYRGMLAWIAALVAVVAGGALWRIAVRPAPEGWGSNDPTLTAVMLAWTAFACVVGTLALFMCVEVPNRRREQRFPGRDQPVEVAFGAIEQAGRVVDISCSGVLVELPRAAADLGPVTRVALEGVGWVDARPVRRPAPNRWALELMAEGALREKVICHVLSLRFVSPVVRGSLAGATLAAAWRLLGGLRGLWRRRLPPSATP